MRTLAVVNQKSRVGKTTAVANIGHCLALKGCNTLIVDLDPLGNLSSALGIFRMPRQGMDKVLLDGFDFSDVVINSREGLGLVPAGAELAKINDLTESGISKGERLKKAIARQSMEYDYILFDCPSSSGILTANAILAVDEIVIPLICNTTSFTDMAHLLKTVKRMEPFRDEQMRQRIFFNRYHARKRDTKELREKMQSYFSDNLLHSSIRESSVLSECPAMGRTIFEYRGHTKVADDFRVLADEITGN